MEKKQIINILISSFKGIMHAVVIPFCLLWGFDRFGNIALAISLSYIILVGAFYFFNKENKLSGAIFFGILKTFFLFAVTLAVVLEIEFVF